MRAIFMSLALVISFCWAARAGEVIIPAKTITVEYVTNLLKRNGHTVAPPDKDGDIIITYINTDRNILLSVNDEKIEFVESWILKDDVSELRKLRFVNEFNQKYVLQVFATDEVIATRSQLNFKEGVTNKQILHKFDLHMSFLEKLLEINNNYDIFI